MTLHRHTAAALVLAAAILCSGPASALTAREVLVVGNAGSAASRQIVDHYVRSREIPRENVLLLEGLGEDPPDHLTRDAFDRLVHEPIAGWLTSHAAQDRICCIVLTKGLPVRIAGTRGRSGTMGSVDSELTLMYRRLTGATVPTSGAVPNPYFLGDQPVAAARPFSHERLDTYLVTRLDGFTVQDVLALIDRGLAASREGQIVLDERAGWGNPGNVWLRAAAERLRQAGFEGNILHDATSQGVTNQSRVLGYYSWGTNDPALRTRRLGLSFEPGAIAGAFVSTDGRTFREPPADWQVAGPAPRDFAGSGDSLAADLIRDGVTGISAHVAEPFLDGAIRPDILFPAYLAGFTLAEAYYLAMPSLGWQSVIVGDPLCAPFRGGEATESGTPPLDPATELPAWFSARKVAAHQEAGLARAGVEALVRADARRARGDEAGMVEALQEAIRTEPRLTGAHHLLAAVHERAGEYDKAEERYRAVLRNASNDVVALNNLAFLVAVRRGAPAEALPLAQRARALAPASPAVADTLGWIYYLLGDPRQASSLLDEAARAAPANADILVHSAIVHHAAGDASRARADLGRALELAPALAGRGDVERLREQLQ